MNKQLKIALIQQHASPDLKNNVQRGVQAFEKAAQEGAKLIAFAELAFTPFYPQNPAQDHVADLAEPIPGPTTEVFSALAKKYQVRKIVRKHMIHHLLSIAMDHFWA